MAVKAGEERRREAEETVAKRIVAAYEDPDDRQLPALVNKHLGSRQDELEATAPAN